jgi:large subunit ribosomal protein L21
VYAVVRTGGKQYRVEEGRAIRVDRLAGEPGDTVELADVLLMGEGDDVTVGAPTIDGARVLGTIAEQGRADKIVVFRYKSKTRQRKKTGHRQPFTRLVVSDILAAGQEPKARAAAEPEETAVVEEAPKPKRSRRKAAAADTVEASAAEAPVAKAAPKRSRKTSTE